MVKKESLLERGYEFLLFDSFLKNFSLEIEKYDNLKSNCLESERLEQEKSIRHMIERYIRLDCLSESDIITTSDKTKNNQIKNELRKTNEFYKKGLDELTKSLENSGFTTSKGDEVWRYFWDSNWNSSKYYCFDSEKDVGFATKIYLKIDPKRFLNDQNFNKEYFSIVEKIAREFSKQEIGHTFKMMKEFFEDKKATGNYDSPGSYLSGNECLIFYLNAEPNSLSKAKGIIKEMLRDYNITDEEIRVFRVGHDRWDNNLNACSTYTQMVTREITSRILKKPKDYYLNLTSQELEEKLNHDLQEIRKDIFNEASKYVTN
ncbi:MAG TPA: hypothetical protein PLX15_04690 [Candidatus Woesearchaeota archaeon]|nr:hypothetical protein [Candidatus Woesearchaeota archaeon]